MDARPDVAILAYAVYLDQVLDDLRDPVDAGVRQRERARGLPQALEMRTHPERLQATVVR